MYIPDSLIEVYGARIGPYGIAVYCYLASQADTQGQAERSIDHIATMIGLSRRSIIRALLTLTAEGLLTKQQVQQRNVYQLMLPSAPQAPVPHRHQCPTGTSAPQALLPIEIHDELPSLGLPVLDSSPVPDPKTSLDPKKNKTKARKARARKAAAPRHKILMTRDPTTQHEWYTSIVSRPSFQEWIQSENLTHMDLAAQWKAFVRKALANGYKYLDWYSAFQNWLTSPYQHTQNGSATGMTYTQEETDRILDEEEKWRATL